MFHRMWRFLFLIGLLSLVWEKSVPAGQQANPLSTDSNAGHLSEPYRSAWCSAAMRLNQHQPIWAHGHLSRLADGNFPLDLVVFDSECKQASAAHVAIPGWSVTSLITAVPGTDADAIVSGNAMTNPGLTFFLAKVSSGGVVSLTRTERFMVRGLCEASDHTIWTLGQDHEKEKAHEDYPVVQQYSFEKGFLHGTYQEPNPT